ncbi:transposase [Colletotrichum plurivorum]|uniref:Transposase n=1 Tax=Colletotrichum plurivorum TaxID=2175906 RepID=A0A8H6N9A2_9PEZI|nr:transposase [Colletotrichum plurivorum]
MSRLLLENSNKATNPETPADGKQASNPTIDLDIDTSQIIWSTPRKSVELKDQVAVYSSLQDVDKPTSRLLFKKITKAFDEKVSQLATAAIRIEGLEARLEAAKPRKRRKVKMSPNSKFADIEAIHKAQLESGDIEAVEVESDASSEPEIIQECIVCK